MANRQPLELRVGSTIRRGDQMYVIREMRFHTPIPPDYATTSDLGGCVTLFIEPEDEPEEEDEEATETPFPGSVKIATLTPDEFDAFTKKHNIKWEVMGP